ncbi:3-deoxy-D-manno-octulosonic acid transferase [Bacteroidia bacterium]|nr:3-deoxy-D-manno-octulosonic acid transferase [Bacteroidia bacterium]
MGEFEQGRPIIEQVKKQHPEVQILLTFFSPSGFEGCKNYAGADYVAYLPLDFAGSARRFASAVKPAVSVFIKYEYWHHHINALHKSGTQLYLASAIFRPQQVFFKPIIGIFFRNILKRFSAIFVQDEDSLRLLQEFDFEQVTVSGDTRFDRVVAIAEHPQSLPQLEAFAHAQEVLVAGSTWQQDEDLLLQIANNDEHLRIIFVPHEIHQSRINKLMQQLQRPAVRYSALLSQPQLQAADYQYIVVDKMGVLSSVYQFARYAYIGGGFGAGIHNTLEAAVYGVPVFFGTHYHKFKEAKELIAQGGAFCVKNASQLHLHLHNLKKSPSLLAQSGQTAKNYVTQHLGATQKICNSLKINNL